MYPREDPTRGSPATNNSQDRPWNDPAPRGNASDEPDTRPILRAIILDFASVNFVDATAVQALVDLRNQMARHAAPENVEWHLTNITDRWTKRALVANGFGFASREEDQSLSLTLNLAGVTSEKAPLAKEDEESRGDAIRPVDSNSGGSNSAAAGATLYGANWPFFHPDLRTATESAVVSARARNSAGSF